MENLYQEFEADLYQIVQRVFSEPVAKPFTYQIIFDPNEISPNSNYTQYVFEQLLMIFTEGLKIFYGKESIEISLISPPDFYQIQQYFQSMGFTIDCKIEKILDEEKVRSYLETGDLPSFQNSSNDSSNDSKPKNISQSSSGQSKIETVGESLADYRFLLTRGNDRYVITFDYL